MKRLPLLIFLLPFVSSSAFPQMIRNGAQGMLPSTLGGPVYSARTDSVFTPIPAIVPDVGGTSGTGRCTSQPAFSNEVCRVTDINFWNGTSVADRQQWSICCGGWDDLPAWSADSTVLTVQNLGSGSSLAHIDDSIDPPGILPMYTGAALSCPATPSGPCNVATTLKTIQWDRTNPHVFYFGAVGADGFPGIFEGNYTDPSAPIVYSELIDYGTAPNCAPVNSGQTVQEFFADQTGQNFYAIIDSVGQDSWHVVTAYNMTNGCRWFDTLQQVVHGNYGSTGPMNEDDTMTITNTSLAANVATYTFADNRGLAWQGLTDNKSEVTITGTTNGGGIFNVTQGIVTSSTANTFTVAIVHADVASAADPGQAIQLYTLHSLRGSLDGTTMLLGGSNSTGGGRRWWTVTGMNTATVTPAYSTSANVGHFTNGNHTFWAESAKAADSNACVTPPMVGTNFQNPAISVNYMPTSAGCLYTGSAGTRDSHASSSNNPPSDNYPVFKITMTGYANGALPVQPGDNEIIAVSRATLGNFWRFGSTYNSQATWQAQSFSCQEAEGTISPNGKWMAFTTDWEQTLGLDVTARPRCDVFIIRLR